VNPTSEELDICRRLPKHQWEAGDKLLWPLIDAYKKRIWTEMFVVNDFFERIDAKYTGQERLHTIYKNHPDLIFLPHPHQIMALKEWPEAWTLGYGNASKSWGIVEAKLGKVKVVVKYGCATARLACLRAIEPFLKEKQQ